MKLTFEKWWQEFVRENDRDVDAAIEPLHQYVAQLHGDVRSEFIGELAKLVCGQEPGSGIAAAVLESVADGPACDLLFGQLQRLTRADLAQQELEMIVVRILARADAIRYDAAVTAFLFAAPVGWYFSSVVWTQWPHRPNVFGRAIVRYFGTKPPESVRGNGVIQAFLSTPEALAAVKSACISVGDFQLWQRIADAVRGTTLPGMTTAKKDAVSKILAIDAG